MNKFFVRCDVNDGEFWSEIEIDCTTLTVFDTFTVVCDGVKIAMQNPIDNIDQLTDNNKIKSIYRGI